MVQTFNLMIELRQFKSSLCKFIWQDSTLKRQVCSILQSSSADPQNGRRRQYGSYSAESQREWRMSKIKVRACDGWKFFDTVFWFTDAIHSNQYRWKKHFFLYFAATFWKVILTSKANAQWKRQHINCTVRFRSTTAMFS